MELEIWNTVIKGTWKNTPKYNTIKMWSIQFHENAMQFPKGGHSRQTGWQPVPASLLVTWNKEDAEMQLNSWSSTVAESLN